MKQIYKINKGELRRQVDLVGSTPLPEDSPYYSEGASMLFLSPTPKPSQGNGSPPTQTRIQLGKDDPADIQHKASSSGVPNKKQGNPSNQ